MIRKLSMVLATFASVFTLNAHAQNTGAAGTKAAETPAPTETAVKTIQFASLDGVTISADLFAPNPIAESPLFVLFHQAEASRGEYKHTAPLLAKRNMNVMAVDLRCGNAMNGVANATHKAAKKAGKPTNYLDAYQDMLAAVRYAKKKFSPKRVYVMGSSFSASLVLRLTAEHPDLVSAVFAFSPAEYFQKKGYIQGYAKKIRRPTFIASAKWERPRWKAFLTAIRSRTKVGFAPKKLEGYHGSRALWSKTSGQEQYWAALDSFLSQLGQ